MKKLIKKHKLIQTLSIPEETEPNNSIQNATNFPRDRLFQTTLFNFR